MIKSFLTWMNPWAYLIAGITLMIAIIAEVVAAVGTVGFAGILSPSTIGTAILVLAAFFTWPAYRELLHDHENR